MHATEKSQPLQQAAVVRHARHIDSNQFFNLLTGPQLSDALEDLLPGHRQRLFAPTETLSMFLAQALSALLFLYREVLGVELPLLDGVEHAKRPSRLPVVLTQSEVHVQTGGPSSPLSHELWRTGCAQPAGPVAPESPFGKRGFVRHTGEEPAPHSDAGPVSILLI